MQTATEAEEHLRVIRSLMEKATIYRAVSAPTALAGGIAALVVAAPPVQALYDRLDLYILRDLGDATKVPLVLAIFLDQLARGNSFHARWLLALVVTLLVNTLLILREARRRGDPLISPGLRAALRALLPPMLCGGVFFAILGPPDVSAFLLVFYGLGLLATGHFAPRSIIWLGWSFLVAGLGDVASHVGVLRFASVSPDLIMAATFGGFHLIYAACTWPRGAQTAALNGAP